MKQLPVRFNEKQTLQIGDLVECLGSTTTDVSRVALALGMQQLKELAARDKESAQELLAVTAFKVMQ
ncbi:hypothetical protein NVP1054O_58 [Vibrio phage 1.054.O._10N.261.52.A1]|nr:hypothetical protein NVP1054O_58 [Vibrio phage 1.054.O._10N.261.52.A1]